MALTVSTSCPSCGGGLDFEEGSNAVHCPYCGLDHVVTGHGRVLSYFIPENIDAKRAVALAMDALRPLGGGWRPRDATLFFVPYHRFAGQVLRWEVQEVVVGEDGSAVTRARPLGAVSAEEMLAVLSGEPGSGTVRLGEKRFELDARYTDRTLPALDAPELKLWSLGLRPSALKLSLFEKDAVASRGRIVPAGFTYAEREEKGFAPVRTDELVARRVFAKTRSVVYFPVWVVEAAGPPSGSGEGAVLAVLDGLTGTVTNPEAPVSLLGRLIARDGDGFETARFRPLKCPECAGPLPLKPKDVVFFCPGCKKAWRITGSELVQTAYKAAKPKSVKPGALEYLPFWVVRARMSTPDRTVEDKYELSRLAPGMNWPKEEDKKVPLRFFVPAFRMGNLKTLSRVASSFTRYQPVFEEDTPRNYDGAFRAKGCHISPEDALELAPLILFSLVPKGNKNAVRFALEAKVEPVEAGLVLMPYYRGRFDYVDGLFGWSVPANTIKL